MVSAFAKHKKRSNGKVKTNVSIQWTEIILDNGIATMLKYLSFFVGVGENGNGQAES